MGGWFSKEAIITTNNSGPGVLTVTSDHLQQITLVVVLILFMFKLNEYYKYYMKKKALKLTATQAV